MGFIPRQLIFQRAIQQWRPLPFGNCQVTRPFSVAGGKQKEPAIKKEWHADGRIARLILNNPKRRNPLSFGMMNQLQEELKELSENPKARAVILASSAEDVFSAGHDLKELSKEAGARQHHKVFAKCMEMMEILQQIQLPVIAEVDGLVTAAASQLVSSCDIVVATQRSTFACPGIKIGLFCNTPGIAMARNLPRKLLLDMLMTSREITAQEAVVAGLVSRVVPDGQAQAEALRVAEEICKYSRSVMALGKAFFYTQIEQNIHTANRMGAKVMCENLKLPDAEEGIAAFLEKRQPKWAANTTDEKTHN